MSDYLEKLNLSSSKSRPGDRWIIQEKDYDSWTIVHNLSFSTKELAKEFLKRYKKWVPHQHDREFSISRIPGIDSMEDELIQLLFQ
jgi:hypothetical protein